MDSLPDHLILEILNRLNDSTELARCKLVSKTLNSLARQVRSIHLHCWLDLYTKMRSPETSSKVTPFKSIFDKLISEAPVPIDSVSLGVDESVERSSRYDYDSEEEDKDDLFLTAGPFSDDWMTKIGHGLKSILIEDFDAQSGARETDFLEVVSYHCHSLVELKLKNACLSADDMHLMPLLTRLTLINVTIFDECLNKLMECVPCLQVLNLIDSGGGTDPKIHHLNLKELKYMGYHIPGTPDISSTTVFAPNLTKLEFECDDQITLSIHAPLVSYFHFGLLDRVDVFNVVKFKTLKTLRLVSSILSYVLFIFPSNTIVQNLTLDSPIFGPVDEIVKFSLSNVFATFPNVTSLTLGSEVWSKQMVYTSAPSRARNKMKGLKQITVYLVLGDIDGSLSFILYLVGICTKLSDIVLFIHRDVDLSVAISFVSSCMSRCSKVRWRWGTWKKGTKDCCIPILK